MCLDSERIKLARVLFDRPRQALHRSVHTLGASASSTMAIEHSLAHTRGPPTERTKCSFELQSGENIKSGWHSAAGSHFVDGTSSHSFLADRILSRALTD